MSLTLLQRFVISLCFGIAGITKVTGLEFEVDAFLRWGFAPGFMVFIGILEIAGAVGVWIRRLDSLAALCLALLAAGALLVRLVHGEWILAAVTAILLLITLHFGWQQRDELLPQK